MQATKCRCTCGSGERTSRVGSIYRRTCRSASASGGVCVCDLESGCSAGAADRWRWPAWWVIYGENRGILPPSVAHAAVTHAPPCSRFSRITYTVIRPRHTPGRAGLAVSSEVAGGWSEGTSQPASAQSQEHARWLDRLLDTPVAVASCQSALCNAWCTDTQHHQSLLSPIEARPGHRVRPFTHERAKAKAEQSRERQAAEP